MRERPILFSGPMVRAILEGRKTQTRRVLKKQPYLSNRNPPRFADTQPGDLFVCPDYFPTDKERRSVIVECESLGVYHAMGQKEFAAKHCPYGQPGDRLWVRETFSIGEDLGADWVRGYAQGDRFVILDGGHHEYIVPEGYECPRNAKETHNSEGTAEHWREFGPIPSIFMPRWASRITLEITGVRVERLQDISEADAIQEGISRVAFRPCDGFPLCDGYMVGPDDGKTSLHPKAAQAFQGLWQSINGPDSWKANPFVWVIEFKRVQGAQ